MEEMNLASLPKNNIYKYLFFICLFVLLVLIICFYLFLKINSKNTLTQKNNNVPQVTPVLTITSTPKISVITSTTSPDGSVECYQNQKYFVALKDGQSEDSRILVKLKNNQNSYNDCSYNLEKSDFEIKEWITMILNLDNNFLLTDTGTAPGIRGLSVYDLDKKTKIYDGSYSGGGNPPVEILDNNIISFWEETKEKPTENNCPELKQNEENGLGSAIEEKVNLNLITLKKELLKEYRCSARQ